MIKLPQQTLAISLLWLTSTQFCSAAPVTFTDDSLFFSATSGFSNSILDFESQTGGDIINNGDEIGRISFAYDFGGVSMQVGDTELTVSGNNYLGTDDGDIFLSGDDFNLSFSASHAIGLYFITADTLLDTDLMLSVGATTANLIAADIVQTLSDGSDVYFLGIVDTEESFTAASITAADDTDFLFNVDDISTATAVPAPSIIYLLGLGLLSLFGMRKNYL